MTVAFALAQLRHAYTQAINGQIGDQPSFGRHLLGPAIARLEQAHTPAATGETGTHCQWMTNDPSVVLMVDKGQK